MLVKTSNQNEQKQLEQDYISKETYYMVPSHRAASLLKILKSIKYEHFNYKSSSVVDKIEKILNNAVNLKLNLDQYHELLAEIKKQQNTLEKYQQYMKKLDSIILELPASEQPFQEEQYCASTQELLTETLIGRSRSVKSLDFLNIPPLDLRNCSKKQQEQHMNTAQSKQNSQIASQREIYKQTLADLAPPSQRSAIFNREEWKTERSNSNESLHNFEKKGSGIFQTNRNYEGMAVKQIMHDLTREMFFNKDQGKQQKLMTDKYNKSIRQALIYSKLKAKIKKK